MLLELGVRAICSLENMCSLDSVSICFKIYIYNINVVNRHFHLLRLIVPIIKCMPFSSPQKL